MVPLLTISEHASTGYGPRTYANANSADITIAIAIDFATHGEMLTKKASKAYLPITYGSAVLDAARTIYRRLKSDGYKSINLAGNGIYTLSRQRISQYDVNDYIYNIFRLVNEYYPIESLRSGGQTGVDLAAGVVGPLLGISTTMLFPKGFKQRFENGIDVYQTESNILRQVKQWQQLLQTK